MSPIAPLVAGWTRRLGGQPGPWSAPAGSGESPSGQPLQVEMFVGGTWVDITSRVMTRDGSFNVSITRGRPNEGARTDPSSCRFQLNNRDGLFSPRNPLSPYYGQIGRNTQLRVSVPSGNEKSYRFWGEVSEWPQKWDVTGSDVWVELEAAGILRRLGQGDAPLKSALFRDLTNPARASIVAYWPCEDSAGSTSLASGLGGLPMTVSGTPNLAAYGDFAASAPVLTMGTSMISGPVPAYTETGQTSCRMLMHAPDAGVAADQVVLRLVGTGTAAYWDVVLSTSGGLKLRAFDSIGTNILDSGFYAFGVNGDQIALQMELRQTGADVAWALTELNITDTPASTGSIPTSSISGTLSSYTVGGIVLVTVGGLAGLADTAVGHIVLATDTNAFVNTGSALLGWNGEAPSSRLSRLCAEEGIPFESVAAPAAMGANAVTMGVQGQMTLLELLQECADTDLGVLSESLQALGITYRSRLALYNQTAALALSYPGFDLAEVPLPVDDDQFTRNDITVTRRGGTSARLVLPSGSLSVLPPPFGVGRYDEARQISLGFDSLLTDQAGWRLHLGTVDEARYPQIAVNLAHPSFTSSTTKRIAALSVRPGDRVTISGPPAWLPPDDISQLVLGFTEVIDQFQHRLAFNCAPESPYRVAVADDSTFGVVDSDASQVVGDTLASATTLSVAVTSGPLWTTSAGDLPFDVMVSGERMTVTAVSGAASPQSFTVTRGVNGITKLLPGGSTVSLYLPATTSL